MRHFTNAARIGWLAQPAVCIGLGIYIIWQLFQAERLGMPSLTHSYNCGPYIVRCAFVAGILVICLKESLSRSFIWSVTTYSGDTLNQRTIWSENAVDLSQLAEVSYHSPYASRRVLPKPAPTYVKNRDTSMSWFVEIRQGSQIIRLYPPAILPRHKSADFSGILRDVWRAYEENGYM